MKPRLAPAGYSGTPLAKKLGIIARSEVLVLNAPADYESLLAPLPEDVRFQKKPGSSIGLVHLFVTKKADLSERLTTLRDKLSAETPVWVSWPKKSSGVQSDVTEDVIREVALPLGYVDIKVCAVSEVWSGLKLVVRKELR